MIQRPIIIIEAALMLLTQSCSHRQYPQQSVHTSTTSTIVETLRDTVVTVEPDTSMLRALIECDSTGQAYLREIEQLKSSDHIHQSLHLKNNILTSTAAIDSMDIYLTYRERYQHDTETTSQVQTITLTTNILYKWQKLLMYIGAIAAMAIIVRLFLRLK